MGLAQLHTLLFVCVCTLLLGKHSKINPYRGCVTVVLGTLSHSNQTVNKKIVIEFVHRMIAGAYPISFE
jgi:hypothetical protein